jgi:hypothetical protein
MKAGRQSIMRVRAARAHNEVNIRPKAMMEYLIGWVLFSAAVGIWASNRGRSSIAWCSISLLLSPLVAFVFLAASKNLAAAPPAPSAAPPATPGAGAELAMQQRLLAQNGPGDIATQAKPPTLPRRWRNADRRREGPGCGRRPLLKPVVMTRRPAPSTPGAAPRKCMTCVERNSTRRRRRTTCHAARNRRSAQRDLP